MEEENIIDDLISENRNEFDEISSRSTFIFEELSNKLLSESSASNSLNHLKLTEPTKDSNETQQSNSNTDVHAENQVNENIENENDENVCISSGNVPLSKATRPCLFAINRIKTIMKLDPELALASKESTYLICKATVRFFLNIEIYIYLFIHLFIYLKELFVDFIATEAYKFTSQGSRKTLQKKDIG